MQKLDKWGVVWEIRNQVNNGKTAPLSKGPRPHQSSRVLHGVFEKLIRRWYFGAGRATLWTEPAEQSEVWPKRLKKTGVRCVHETSSALHYRSLASLIVVTPLSFVAQRILTTKRFARNTLIGGILIELLLEKVMEEQGCMRARNERRRNVW